jgi:hypothetical protein
VRHDEVEQLITNLHDVLGDRTAHVHGISDGAPAGVPVG